MKFEYKEVHHYIESEELLRDVREVAMRLKKSALSIKEYDEHGEYSSSAVMRRFGTWNKALKLAGLGVCNEYYSREDLFFNIEEVWIKKGAQPVRQDMNNRAWSSISSGAYLRAFGRWSEALRAFVKFVNSEQELEIQASQSRISVPQRDKRDVNLRLRFLVMKRDNFKCCACGASPATDPRVVLHVDHIVPWAKGGRTEMDNLQTLCANCNQGKSDLI